MEGSIVVQVHVEAVAIEAINEALARDDSIAINNGLATIKKVASLAGKESALLTIVAFDVVVQFAIAATMATSLVACAVELRGKKVAINDPKLLIVEA